MKSELRHVCCNIDDNYAQHCGVMLCSLFENNKQEQFEIHILISSLKDENKENLNQIVSRYDSVCHFHIVNSELLKDVKYRAERPLSEATYYRILLASTLDESISKILYLDSDMIVLGDISPIFEIDLQNYALAAARDLQKLTDELRFILSLPQNAPYFNAGMMLINLDYWREHKSEQLLIDFSKNAKNIYNHDQDALNAVFNGHWFMLTPRWNRFFPYNYESSFFENDIDRKAYKKDPVIIHYVNYFKAWNRFIWIGVKWHKYRNCYYQYLKLTPWANFKSSRVTLEQYRKFSLYKFLAIFSIQSLCIDIKDLFLKGTPKFVEHVLTVPFLIVLKILYKTRDLKNAIYRIINRVFHQQRLIHKH